ncbi:MAG: SGNH/GDSL hydrolase family protein, partial [Oscillospiraceae bacterium]
MKNKVFKRGLSFLLSVLMVFSLLTVIPAVSVGTDAEAASYTNSGTVTAWYTAMCDLNGEQTKEALVDKYFESDGIISFKTNSTFRSRIQLSYGGTTFRVKLTNYYGDTAINVTKMNAALAGNGNATSINGNTIKNITVNGKTSFSIPKGGYVWTDWFTINVSSGGYLVLSSYVANSGKVRDAGLTGSTSYCWMGDQMTNTEWSYGALGKLVSEDPNTGNFEITPMINCVETKTGDTSAYTAVVIGDSTVTNSIPGLIQSKVNGAGLDNVSVVGAGIKGNELLADGVGGDGPLEGDALLTRFDLDALSLAGVKKVFVKIGVNDIVHPNCDNLKQYFDGTPSAQEIINAYKQLISAAHAKGIEIYFFDITPWIGYTRNDTVTTDEADIAQMEAVRLEVNQWLADNCSDYTDEDNMTVDPKSGYSFGYIPVSEAVGELRSGYSDQYVLKSAYTTDHIHYSAAGQTVIANHVPISIFKGVKAEDVEKTASVGNLYVATTSTIGGGYYFFGSSENLSSGASDQQSTIYLMQSDGSETSTPSYYGPLGEYRGAYYGNPVVGLKKVSTTLQRGTVGAPYFAIASSDSTGVVKPTEDEYIAAYWQRNTADNTLIDWTDYCGRKLAWYYPTSLTIDEFDIGTRNSGTIYYSYQTFPGSKWYSLNTILPYNTATSYKSIVQYGSNTGGILSGDKFLSFFYSTPDKNFSDVPSGEHFRVLNSSEHSLTDGNLVTLYAAAQVDTTLGITEASKAQTYYNADEGTVVPFTYTLTDNLANSPTGSKGNVSTLTAPTDKFASYGSFVGYTYGESRSVTWESDNENVAKFENDQVVLTGNAGTANLTMTLTWNELDGTVYTMKDTATVTNIEYNANICIDSYYPETYSVDNFSGSMTKDVSVTYESSPLAELPSGGSWVWSSSDKNIFTVSGSGANATVSFTGNGGTADLTAAYVYNGRTICSDTVTITNNTAGIDIQMADDAIDTAAQAYPDLKRICGINPDDTLTLTAQPVGTGAAGMDMNGSYAWSFEGTAPEGVTLSNADARTATLTFAGTATTATVKLSYTVNGNTYESYVTVTAVPGIAASNVVIDFGLPVQIGLEGEVSGISAAKPGVALDTGVTAGDEYNAAKSAKTAYGSAALNGSTLTYTPEKIALEQDTVYYSAKVDKGYKYSTVDIIPAADVYYEDSFVSYEGAWTSVG